MLVHGIAPVSRGWRGAAMSCALVLSYARPTSQSDGVAGMVEREGEGEPSGGHVAAKRGGNVVGRDGPVRVVVVGDGEGSAWFRRMAL